MKCVKHTITLANLNGGTAQEIDLSLTDEKSIDRIPSEMMVNNATGATIGIVFLDSDAEKTVMTANPTMFDYIPLNPGVSSSVLPASVKYLEIKLLAGVAVANLDIYSFNYIYLDK